MTHREDRLVVLSMGITFVACAVVAALCPTGPRWLLPVMFLAIGFWLMVFSGSVARLARKISGAPDNRSTDGEKQ